MMHLSEDCSTQTTPLDFVEENNGCAVVPLDVTLNMLDKALGAASSDVKMNENILHESNENLLSLSTLKSLEDQLNSIMKSIQARSSELVAGIAQDSNPEKYWLGRLEQTIGLLQARILKEERK